ncbi:HHIP-like protein 2 [Liolophura sinensis]|uniref:HHIP-like protein 2 n=1 Tax=Liolophura sinensis TaxID=3198878 RepID=UPI003158744B
METKQFPGLCPYYCSQLEANCQEALRFLVSHISPELLGDDLCERLILLDEQYCYPSILTVEESEGRNQIQLTNSEDCLCFEEYANKLRNPVGLKYPDDGSRRMFVVEQLGCIYILYENKTRVEKPFLDLRDRVIIEPNKAGDERGLLGLAFHPYFAANGRIFVYYVSRGVLNRTRLSEFRVSSDNPNEADANSERVILEIDQPFLNHNAGELIFGEDGFLYIATGDGGAAGDPHNNAQNKNSLLGKMLRIDVDKTTGEREHEPRLPYSSPQPPNPFAKDKDARMEIYAYGLRNPWRCSKDLGDPTTGHGKGRIFCGDVGQDAIEEVNIINKGGNYGWRASEGFRCYDEDLCGNVGEEEKPIYSYDHSVGRSVTGGYVYRGCESPRLNGIYLYADYFVGKIFRLEENITTNQWQNKEIDVCGPELCNDGLISSYNRKIMAFGQDPKGEVYPTRFRNSYFWVGRWEHL